MGWIMALQAYFLSKCASDKYACSETLNIRNYFLYTNWFMNAHCKWNMTHVSVHVTLNTNACLYPHVYQLMMYTQYHQTFYGLIMISSVSFCFCRVTIYCFLREPYLSWWPILQDYISLTFEMSRDIRFGLRDMSAEVSRNHWNRAELRENIYFSPHFACRWPGTIRCWEICRYSVDRIHERYQKSWCCVG